MMIERHHFLPESTAKRLDVSYHLLKPLDVEAFSRVRAWVKKIRIHGLRNQDDQILAIRVRGLCDPMPNYGLLSHQPFANIVGNILIEELEDADTVVPEGSESRMVIRIWLSKIRTAIQNAK